MYLLRCPKCNNNMKYMPAKKNSGVDKKTKKCVYCNRNFKVSKNIVTH